MTDPAEHDPDPDATLMERAAEIAQDERRDCSCECADVRTCDIVARLAVRVARAERNAGLDGRRTKENDNGK
jgi:hypothetical protein